MLLRPARDEDLPVLQELERAAGEPFRELGMGAVADDDPPTTAELAHFASDGRAWVVADGDRAVAYLLLAVVDAAAHVEQVSVHPSHARQGLGRRLLDHADAWAAARGLGRLTLTTYADVPWNAPYYARLGFVELTEDEIGPQLRAVRQEEAERGLARWPRVTMGRPVAT